MPLFNKKFNFKTDGLPPEKNRFRHLDKVVVPGKATPRCAEQTGGGTSVVFLPYPNFENPAYKAQSDVLPDRVDHEPNAYSQWIFSADGVWRFGKPGVTMLFDNPDGYNVYEEHPIHLIVNAAYTVEKAKSVVETPFGTSDTDHWTTLLRGDGSGKVFGCLNSPKRLFMTNALIYSSGTENYFADGAPLGAAKDDLQTVFVLTTDTLKSLIGELDKPADASREVVTDISGYLHPEFTGKKFIHFYDKKNPQSCLAYRQAQQAKAQASFGGVRRTAPILQSTAQQNMGGYSAFICDTLGGLPSDPTPPRDLIVKLACDKVRPWEEVLRGHTPQECIHVAAEQCGLPLSLIYHAWKSRPEYYTDEMKHRLKNPRSANFWTPSAAQAAPAHTEEAEVGLTDNPWASSGNDQPAVDPKAAPWGGSFSDPPGAVPVANGAGVGSLPDEAFDQAALAESQAKFAAAKAKQVARGASDPAVARSQAARTS